MTKNILSPLEEGEIPVTIPLRNDARSEIVMEKKKKKRSKKHVIRKRKHASDVQLADLLETLGCSVLAEGQKAAGYLNDCLSSVWEDGYPYENRLNRSYTLSFGLLALAEMPLPSLVHGLTVHASVKLSRSIDVLVRKLATAMSDCPSPVKEGLSDADFELHKNCNVIISETVQLLKGLYNCEAFQDPLVLAQLQETEKELARVKKIIRAVENEKGKMESFVHSASCREAMLKKKCSNQQDLINIAHADLQESEKKVADLRLANHELSRSLGEVKLQLSIVQERVSALTSYVMALKRGDSVDFMMSCAIDLYNENSWQRRKFEQMAQRTQYCLFLEQGLLKVDDPEVKETLDSWYEVSSTSTEESDIATSSSDEGYEEDCSR